MPELPEIEAYLHALRPRVLDARLEAIRVRSVAPLKTYDPPPQEAAGRQVVRLGRLGKRVAIGLERDLWLILHLRVAGRLRWKAERWTIPRKHGLAAPHTLKRALTDPRIFSGIGGAFADEILHRARLSPLQRTCNLSEPEIERLRRAARAVLAEWTAIRIAETGDGFPEKVTAVHPGMAVHGKYRQPCPVCGAPIQRIMYASRETNYCPGCQTDGRVLADRGLSRLLGEDWPGTLEELEALDARRGPVTPDRRS